MYADDEAKPKPAEREALVRVRTAGICRTDLELTLGYMGYEGILGHEFVGVVAEDVGRFHAGQRVVGEINCGCGECSWCGAGMSRHCPDRSVVGILGRHGCMADFLCLPVKNLVLVPDGVPDEDAVFTEPLAAALEVFEQMHIDPRSRVAIIGDGKLGLLIAMVFRALHPTPIVVVGHHAERFHNWDGILFSSDEEIAPDCDSSFDLVIEASAVTEGLLLAMRLVKPRGTIVLKSTMERSAAVDLTPLVINEVTVLGSRCGPFEPAVELLRRGVLPLERLRTASYPIESALEAWERAKSRGSLKVILTMDSSC